MLIADPESPFWVWVERFADIIALAGVPTLLVYASNFSKRLFGRRNFEARILPIESGFKGLICCLSAPLGTKMSADELGKLVDGSDRLAMPLKDSPIGSILKAMEHHRRFLHHCWLIASKDSDPYFKSLGIACKKFFPHVELHEPEWVNDVYGKVDEVYNATHRMFDRCESETNKELTAKDVITDVTGGTKIMSIAVAMACLDIDRKIQYMEQRNRKEFYEIDVTWEKITRRPPAKPATATPGDFHG